MPKKKKGVKGREERKRRADAKEKGNKHTRKKVSAEGDQHLPKPEKYPGTT